MFCQKLGGVVVGGYVGGVGWGELKAMCVGIILLMLRQENVSRRESQSMALLERLIRLDSKDCNFHFRDDTRTVHFKVAYPQTITGNNSNEGLLRQFWHHVWAHYFRRLEQEEMKRLRYVRSLFGEGTRSLARHTLPAPVSHILNQLSLLLSPPTIAAIREQVPCDRETALWAKSLYVNLKVCGLAEWVDRQDKKKSKIIYSKLKQSRKRRRIIKGKKALLRALQDDELEVDQFIQQLQDVEKRNGSDIDREIRELEQQIAANSEFSLGVLEGLQKRIAVETQNENRANVLNLMTHSTQPTQGTSKDLQSLQYLIRCLQQKQIAESVAKILSTERSSGEIVFHVAFQKAINIDPKLISERQLMRLNFLRETSLINFYRTGVKSPYSYICHNYVGFRELMQNRMAISSRLKDKDVLQMMKKGACLASIAQIQHEMAGFNTCHHCKFLYPDYLLFTCKFTSDKQAIPKVNLDAVTDPNLSQSFTQGLNKSRSSQRFTTRRKNCLTSYAKIHDEYVCGRKYCFSCLKDTYSHQNIRQNGICPFCLGVCICTRCLRNEKIARFKNMYSLLGGDLTRIQQSSELEQLQVKQEEVVQRGRGRPKKYALSHVSVNIAHKKLRRMEEEGGKLKRRQVYNIWKRNDSGNDTQEENDPKRKKKRGVGRPRLDKKKCIAVL